MRDFLKIYNEWLNSDQLSQKEKEELLNLKDNQEEIQDRFYEDLKFGTAGLRGKLGMGTNRMNVFTVGRASQGLANFIESKGDEAKKRGVAIAYDVRYFSKEFSELAARILANKGIKVYLHDDITATPILSYSVRELNAISGIVITASHNPREYNGYKVYWEEGSQIMADIAEAITSEIEKLDYFKDINPMNLKEAVDKGLIEYIGQDIKEKYKKEVLNLAIKENIDKNINIIYTPLNGTGNKPVRDVLKRRGFKNVFVVPEQEHPDPDFSTVGYPNPEDTKAFKLSEELGKEKNADILIATDPDCDRLAVEVKNQEGKYIALTGNQTGAVLINYILESRKEENKLPEKGFIVKSVVTGNLGKSIGEKYGIDTYEALTGFKNICGKENELLEKGAGEFIFGYEESIGFVAGTFVRDKDGVIAAMLLAEAAAFYKTKNKTLLDVIQDIYDEHGYQLENNYSMILEGIEGKKRIERIMEYYRENYPERIEDMKLIKYADYLENKEVDVKTGKEEKSEIPTSNVLRFWFDDGSWYSIRPSGTEPKIKIYIYSKDKDRKRSEQKLDQINSKIKEIFDMV
ncbi:phospho-sugar mutase [Geotoga petraea]|jgi:phosphoglucomutase|uniref:Phospho-sugar mutase n=1 Tax=Geotoga petraea TaxID=28234 RepID=A0A1G6JTG0_9BACT|nr:phospho-sugar mutase [Geotoga petraea]MDK2945646.1 phosphoglucomutase [Geotoga sp.]TGG88312.1 phospho-sugar mutase [Geotoga petraea]SDC21931.1 phosphoglucomutase [Geotoga petraea]